MVNSLDDWPFSRASLGLARLSWGYAMADGTEGSERSRGCDSCNREEGRTNASQAITVDLPLEPDGSHETGGAKAKARIVIDYCPRCGRIYDVRCSSRTSG
ncbi:MAG: hypothetical protein Q7O66_05460 [Dehalococcoidia bacterium]|nr:hypothetical protein [Dehalococcoidia bacterium]